jgi:hypothetical protein
MAINYAKLFNRRVTPQSQPIPGSTQVRNSGGGKMLTCYSNYQSRSAQICLSNARGAALVTSIAPIKGSGAGGVFGAEPDARRPR